MFKTDILLSKSIKFTTITIKCNIWNVCDQYCSKCEFSFWKWKRRKLLIKRKIYFTRLYSHDLLSFWGLDYILSAEVLTLKMNSRRHSFRLIKYAEMLTKSKLMFARYQSWFFVLNTNIIVHSIEISQTFDIFRLFGIKKNMKPFDLKIVLIVIFGLVLCDAFPGIWT